MKEYKAIFTGFRYRILIHQMHMLVNLVYFPDQWSINQIPTRKTFSLIPVEELPQYDVRRKGGFSFHDNTQKEVYFLYPPMTASPILMLPLFPECNTWLDSH